MTTVISLKERRKHPRVSDALALQLEQQSLETGIVEELDPVPTHIVKMSCGGLRFLHNTSLESDTSLQLRMFLPSANETICVNSRVIASGEEKTDAAKHCNKHYFVQVEFQQMDTHQQELLENHINYVIEKTGVKNRLATYSA